jgi:hypothetical protein
MIAEHIEKEKFGERQQQTESTLRKLAEMAPSWRMRRVGQWAV